MGILDAIFSNIFIILALLAGVFGLFRNENKKEDNRDKPVYRDTSRTNTPTRQESPREQYETMKEQVETAVEDIQTDTSNEWYQALEDSQRRMKDSLDNENLKEASDAIKDGSIIVKDRNVSHNISIKENFTHKRLIESLIMSEVLDKPKSQRRRSQA